MTNEESIKIISILIKEIERQQLDIYFKDQTISDLKQRVEEAEKSKEA